jgi:hypothetical protein
VRAIKVMSRRALVVGATTGLVTGILFSVALAGGAMDEARTTAISKEQAVANVTSFVGQAADAKDMVISEPIDGIVGRFYQVDGPEVSASVDAHTGAITSILFTLLVPVAGTVTIDAAEAIQTATKFLEIRHVSAFDFTESVRLVNHGESSEYVVSWERRVGEILVPDSMTVGIDAATGQVFRFLSLHRDYVDPGLPSIGEKAAIELGVKASDLEGPIVVDEARLRIAFNEVGTQRLVWEVFLSAARPTNEEEPMGISHAIVEVDATSGNAVVVGRG